MQLKTETSNHRKLRDKNMEVTIDPTLLHQLHFCDAFFDVVDEPDLIVFVGSVQRHNHFIVACVA